METEFTSTFYTIAITLKEVRRITWHLILGWTAGLPLVYIHLIQGWTAGQPLVDIAFESGMDSRPAISLYSI